MPLRINERSITSNFLPSVYIERITLESSTIAPPMHNLDPHIKNIYEGERLPEYLKENVEISEVAAKSAREQSLKVSLDLSIKQKITNSTNLALSWLSSLNLHEFMQIVVVQTTDPVVSALFSSGDSLFSLMIKEDDAEFLAAYNRMDKRNFRISMEDASFRMKTSLTKYPPRYLSLKDVREARNQRFGKDEEDIIDPENEFKDSSGNIYQDVPFFLSYDLEDVNPSHLAYFTIATLDIKKIIDVYGLEPDQEGKLAIEGKKTVDYVIDGGTTVSKADVYYDNSGKIWAGPVHFRSAGDTRKLFEGELAEGESPPIPYAGYAGESENPSVLTRRRVDNNKIQDFRIVDKLKEFKVDTTPVNNMLNSSLFTREMRTLARDHNVIKEAAFWSSLALSKDDGENINYFFSINLKDVLIKHTKYGHLFSDDSLTEALNHMKIRSMRVFRRRVKKINILNKLGSPVNAEYVFDQNEERTLMGSYSEGGKGQSQGLRQVENMYPATPEVFHFSGTDTSMKDITYGHYRYEVEMDIEDNTVKFFQKAFDTMLGLRNQFEMYFEQAKNPQNFQVATNRFKTRFRESTFADLDGIIKGFVHYFNALRFKQGVTANGAEGVNNSYFVTREDVQALLRMSKPMTGSPHSIGLVLNFFDSLLESYSQVLGYNLGASSMFGLDTDVQNLKGHGRKSSSPSAESVRLYHHFREVWDSDIPKNYGYNYLDIESSDLPGINVMSGVSLEERANIEIATYYNEPGEVRIADDKYDLGLYDTEQSKFTFFSPSSINIGNNQVPLCGEQTFNTEINDTVVGAIAGMNFSFGSPNLNFFLVQQDGAPRSAFGNMLQLSSNASMMNSIVKTDREFSPIVTPQQREEEFNGRTMSADCPPDEPEDRDDVTINEASGPANRPQIDIRSISKGKESLARHLSLDAIMAGTGFKANYAVAGNNYRIADPKKGMETVAKERLGYSGINKLMTNVVGMVVHQKMTPLARTKSFSARGGRSGIGSNLGGQQIKNRETRAINKITTGLLRTTGNPKQERNKEIEKLPPQHMSLLAGGKAKVSQEQITVGGQVNPNLAAETFATAILNYHCLGELQFFVGYARKSEHVFMNEPKFERLDRTRLIANSGRRLLCRIVRYEDKQLGFLEPKGLVMPIYDRYFILDVMSGLSDIAAPIDPPTEPIRQETVGNLEIAANQVKAQNVLVATLEEGAENRENPAWVMAGAASGGAAYLRGSGVGAMTGPARAARQRELAEESERQRQCYLSEHQGFRNEHAQPDTWRWHPGATDWCARANRIEVLTPVEMESCHLWAARVYARSVNCENQYGSLSMKCYDPRHSERYERHKARHGYTRAGNGKCGKRCGEDEVMMFLYRRLADQKCAYHPYRTFNSRGQRKLIPFHPDEGY